MLKKFFSGLWTVVKTYLIISGVFWTLMVAGFLAILITAIKHSDAHLNLSRLAADDSSGVDVSKEFIVQLDLDEALKASVGQRSEMKLAEIFSDEMSRSSYTLARALETLSKNKNFKGLLLNIKTMRGSMVSLSELEKGLAKVKAQNIPIVAYSPGFSVPSYKIASYADQIVMPEAGGLFMVPPSFQMTFLKDLFDKVGVNFTLVRVGDYKGFGEPFTRNEPSPALLENYDALIQSISSNLYNTVSEQRALDTAAFANFVNKGFFRSGEALQAGLVDKLGFIGDAKAIIQKLTAGDAQMQLIEWDDLPSKILREESKAEAVESNVNEAIGFIKAEGEIRLYSTDEFDDKVITADNMREKIEFMLENKSIKGVLIQINSPGGDALAADIIWKDMMRLKEAKPVVVLMSDVAASGGYYMAAAASKIMAYPNTITGSIGVFGLIPSLDGFAEKYGIHFYTRSQSDRRDLLDPSKPPSPEDIAIIQASIDEVYQRFLGRIGEVRESLQPVLASLGGGRVYTGSQALANGLVDQLGGIDDAFRELKTLSGLDPEKRYPLKFYSKSENWLEKCFKSRRNMQRCFGSLTQLQLSILPGLNLFSEATLDEEKANMLAPYRYLLSADGPQGNILALSPLAHSRLNYAR